MSDYRKIKLIWDFKGSAAEKTAEHHERHLKEYIASEQLELNLTGYEHLNDMYSLAFMVVYEPQIPEIRDSLKPHRAEVYEN